MCPRRQINIANQFLLDSWKGPLGSHRRPYTGDTWRDLGISRRGRGSRLLGTDAAGSININGGGRHCLPSLWPSKVLPWLLEVSVSKAPYEGNAGQGGPAPPPVENLTADPNIREQFQKTAEALAAATAREVELLHEIAANQGRIIANLEEQICALKIHLHLLRQGRN